MIFSYGEGTYIEGEKTLPGEIILGEHKLYLRNSDGDLSQTFLPLEKIVKIKKTLSGLEVLVETSVMVRYTALLKMKNPRLGELIKDLVERRGFKKRFLINEWVDADQ